MARLQNYSFGRVAVDGSGQTRDVIVLPDRIVTDWWRHAGRLVHERVHSRGFAGAQAQAYLERHGTFAFLMSETLTSDQLVTLAARLVPAPAQSDI